MHQVKSETKSAAKSVLAVLCLLALAVAITFVAGYVALATMPCSWFGTSNEGACGYGALFFVLKAGFVLVIALSAMLIGAYVWFQDRRAQRAAASSGESPTSLQATSRVMRRRARRTANYGK
jgi:membrane protein implicated in regulation of membrane protease activity